MQWLGRQVTGELWCARPQRVHAHHSIDRASRGASPKQGWRASIIIARKAPRQCIRCRQARQPRRVHLRAAFSARATVVSATRRVHSPTSRFSNCFSNLSIILLIFTGSMLSSTLSMSPTTCPICFENVFIRMAASLQDQSDCRGQLQRRRSGNTPGPRIRKSI